MLGFLPLTGNLATETYLYLPMCVCECAGPDVLEQAAAAVS